MKYFLLTVSAICLVGCGAGEKLFIADVGGDGRMSCVIDKNSRAVCMDNFTGISHDCFVNGAKMQLACPNHKEKTEKALNPTGVQAGDK